MTFDEYVLPGDRVLPEGIVVGPDRLFYAGSSVDGTVFRGHLDRPTTEAWLAPGLDGRISALGMAIRDGRLVICGGRAGRLFVYDLSSGELLDSKAVDGFLNDVCFLGDACYVTDSARPVLWRYEFGGDLTEVGMPAATEDAYLNGITATPGGEALLVAAQGTETLWRLEPDSGKAELVAEDYCADGLLLIGDTLYGACNRGETMEDAVFFLAGLRLEEDGRRTTPLGTYVEDRFSTPTTLDTDGERLLIVNSQFAKRDSAAPPFQVIAVPVPLSWQ
jgi:Cu-Zn family superoxide dismutase